MIDLSLFITSIIGTLALFYWLGMNWVANWKKDRRSAWQLAALTLRASGAFAVIATVLVFWSASAFEPTPALEAMKYGVMILYAVGLFGIVIGVWIFLRLVEGAWPGSWYFDSILFRGDKDMPLKPGKFLTHNEWIKKKDAERGDRF